MIIHLRWVCAYFDYGQTPTTGDETTKNHPFEHSHAFVVFSLWETWTEDRHQISLEIVQRMAFPLILFTHEFSDAYMPVRTS